MRVEFKHTDAVTSPPRARGTGARLVAELVSLADGHGVLLEHHQRAWASVTFSGTRHELALRFDGENAVAGGERLIEAVGEHEFAIPGQLVADVAVVAVVSMLLPEPGLTVRLEVLVLEEG